MKTAEKSGRPSLGNEGGMQAAHPAPGNRKLVGQAEPRAGNGQMALPRVREQSFPDFPWNS